MIRNHSDTESVELEKLPLLPPSWRWCLPKDLCSQVASGSTPKPDLMYAGKGEVPFIKVYNLTDRGTLDFSVKPTFIDKATHLGLLNRSRALPGDVLINIVGPPLGKVSLVPTDYPEWNINQAIVVFRPESGVSNKYLAFAFLTDSIMRRVTALAKATAGQFNIGVGMCRSLLPVPLAPTNEQHRIVAKIEELFSELDAGVAALKRVRANLKRYRSTVLKAAVEGRLTEMWRAAHRPSETGAELLQGILNERRQKWEAEQLAAFAAAKKDPPKNWQAKYKEPAAPDTSDQPTLPEGWRWASTDQVGEIQLGRQRSPKNVSKDYPTKYIRAANLTEDGLSLDDVLEMEFTPSERDNYLLENGDLLLSEASGSPDQVGKPVIWASQIPNCCFQNTVIRLRPFAVASDFLLVVFKHLYFNKVFARIAAGVGINHLSAAKFAQVVIPLPPLAEQRVIVEAVEQALTVIRVSEAEVERSLARASRLRQSVLKQAFEGKLVAQDPNDEPASVLLERIRQQRFAVPSSLAGAGQKPAKLTKEMFLRRASIGSYIVRRLSPHRSFGRTELVKTLHLTQAHVGVDLQFAFVRDRFGPLDTSVYKLEGAARKNGWFTTQKRPSFGVTYHPGPKIDQMCQYAPGHLGDRQAALDGLLDHIAKMNTDEAELFATAYAAWNDLLIDGRAADDDAIIAEVHGWHEEKKRFTPDVIRKRLHWMRQNGYVPTGQGQRTQLAPEKARRGKKRKP